jgi:hypothetical protein
LHSIICNEPLALMRVRSSGEFLCNSRASQDVMREIADPSGNLREFYFIVERQHGSSEKEGPSQRKQGGPQRFGAQGSAHARPQEGSSQGRAQAQVARFKPSKTEKPADSPAFLR